MLRNSNTIVLQKETSKYEEFPLDPNETGLALPGTILAIGRSGDTAPIGNFVNKDGVYKPNGYNATTRSEMTGMGKGMLTTKAGTIGAPTLGVVRPFIVMENVLLGTALNKPSIPGSVIPGYVLGDNSVFNVRCVPGRYTHGQPVYLTQTANGLYATGTAVVGAPLLGYVEENYVVTAANTDLVDNSTYETPPLPQTAGAAPNAVQYMNLNGALVNLLRVSIKFVPALAATAPTP